MELSEIRGLVRDLDLTLQPRSAPRYKIWLPLATQQLRLRSLIQIIGHNLSTDVKCDKRWFYYTLHRTSMSSPLYTSEPIDNANPRWASFEVPTLHATGHSAASECVLRLWRRAVVQDSTTDIAMFAWGLSFTGLAYLGTKLPTNLETLLHDNSLVFYLHGGFFAPPYCLLNAPDLRRYLHISVNVSEIRDSYTVNKLSSLRSKMHALKQQSESVRSLRERIASGDEPRTKKYPQSSLNRLLQPRQVSREKKAEILRIRKELEVAKFRTKLLEQERVRKMVEIRVLNQLHASITEENQDHGSDLMGRYRDLNKDIERLREWRQSHVDSRETYIQTTAQLAYRRRQLISELSLIYPIFRRDDGKYTINDVHLPDSEQLDSCNDTQVAVALGSVAHTAQMVASFLNVPTRYPIIHCGSRSKVVDHVTDSLPDKDRQFPLFARGKDKLQFHYAVYLLNKNLAQLRWYCGLPTVDLRATLPNLASLVNIKPNQPLDGSKRTFSGSSLDTETSSGKHIAPLTPPFQKIMFEKCHRPSRSIGQFKTVKSFLGSSLDQGLNKPIQLPILSSQSKRICKSEESAIDNKILSLPIDSSSNGSDETLNDTVFGTINTDEDIAAGFVRVNNATLIGNDIEITIPTSVIKLKSTSESLENFVDVRHRSSNSISSCEMALTASQIEGEDSSNGDTARIDQNIEGELITDENSEFHRIANARSKQIQSIHNDKSASINGENSKSHDVTDSGISHDNQTQQHTSRVTDLAHDEEKSVDSYSTSDDAMGYTSETMEQKRRAGSLCCFPEECLIADKVPRRKRYDSETREGGDETQRFLEDWRASGPTVSSEEQLAHLEHDPMLRKGALMTTPLSNFCPEKECVKSSDPQASSEYIDSIRRSSENVFARTEALANKKTSFKVMRPRQ